MLKGTSSRDGRSSKQRTNANARQINWTAAVYRYSSKVVGIKNTQEKCYAMGKETPRPSREPYGANIEDEAVSVVSQNPVRLLLD